MELGLNATDRESWKCLRDILGFGLFMGFVNKKRHRKYHQPHPLNLHFY